MDAQVWEVPYDRHRRLSELGLRKGWFTEPAKYGLFAWARCTANHPVPFPGYSQWAETIVGVREPLIPQGWRAEDRSGLPLAVNADRSLAITAWTGDEGTGNARMAAFSKLARGPKTVEFVERNQEVQMALDLSLPEANNVPAIATSVPNEVTWILLFHRDRLKRKLRLELSRPVKLGVDKRASEWGERIILSAVPFDDDLVGLDEPNLPDVPGEDFEIQKRGA